jgi:flagellar motor switch protein FliM
VSEPVLTQEELEALYSAMQADGGEEKSVDEYVLASEHSYNMRCIETWRQTFKQIAPHVEDIFVRKLATRGQVEIEDVRSIDDERANASNIGGMVDVMPLAQTDATSEYKVVSFRGNKIILGIERGGAFKYIQRRTGIAATEEESSENPNRELTSIEQRILDGFFDDILTTLQVALGEDNEMELLKDNPEDFWVDRTPRGPWIHVKLSSESNPNVNVWVKGPGELFMPEKEKPGYSYQRQLERAEIELTLELGRLKLKAFDIWAMRVGDVFPMGIAADDPLDVNIGGIYKLKGKPTVSRGHVAFEMLEQK